MTYFFCGIASGFIGIVLMIRGARAILKKDVAMMAQSHWYGVIFLTISAVCTFLGNGDASYVLMQIPFIIGAGKTMREKVHNTPFAFDWTLRRALALNGALVSFGVAMQLVISSIMFIQVCSAAIISCALTLNNRERMLTALIVGRAGMCLASGTKAWIDPSNPAALVWTLLMSWAVIDNYRVYRKM